MRGATHYVCTGSCLPDDIASAIVESGESLGMESECDRPRPYEVTIRALQKRKWYVILFYQLPQDIRWLVRCEGLTTSIYYDTCMLPWYRSWVWGICVITTALFYYAVYKPTGHSDTWPAWNLPLQSAALIVSCALLLVNFRLLHALDGTSLVEGLRSRIEKTGGWLEREQRPFVTRLTQTFFVLARRILA